jgi:hypothetical protein
MIKRTSLLLLVVLIGFSVVRAQILGPDAAARDFYRWYIRELNADRFPIRQNRPEIRKRVSARLARWLFSPAYSEYGADYFLDLQDWDHGWAKTVAVSGGTVKGNAVNVIVTLPKTQVFERKVMTVSLVRQAGSWKIDRVRGR